MSDDLGTRFRFVPSLRRGFGPTDEFSEDTLDTNARPTMGVDVTPEARARSDDGGGWEEDDADRQLDLHVYGPGDVRGIDDAQVTRVEPEPETRNFPPNYFPFIEFDRPGLPWRFSPEAADGDGRTRPWLTLLTVEDTEDVSVSVGGNSPCPVLELGASVDLERQLPDLRESWAWAHAQLQDDSSRDDWAGWARRELTSVSNVTASRLLSPRNLQAETDYIACLVPTFKAGRLAGLGREPYPNGDGGGNGNENGGGNGDENGDGGDSKTLQFAWDHDSLPPTPFKLPLYHYWRFTAGEQGTFESLVTDLEPTELGEEVGMKEVDVSDPGPDSLVPEAGEPTTHPVAGALYSAPAKGALPDYGKQHRLHTILNKPETLPAGDTGDYPVVGPPLYGKWHVGLEGIPPEEVRDDYYQPEWFRQLNLEPRHRIAASIGGEVVKAHQEQLMSAAWEVVGEVREANKVTKNVQISSLLGDAIETGPDADLSDEVAGDDVVSPAAQGWKIKAELDRIEKLGGLGIEDVVDSPVGDGTVDPGEGTTQPPAGGERGGGAIEGVDPADGHEPVAGGDAVDPEQRISTGYALAGSEQPLLQDSDAPVPDGGAARTEPDGAGTEEAVFYAEYLRTFSAQPEASVQYQRMLRRDGPIARRARFDDDHYDRTLERVRDRTLDELGTLADGLQSREGPHDGSSSSEQPPREPTVDGIGVETPVQRQSRMAESVPPGSATSTTAASTAALDERVPPGSLIGGADLAGQWHGIEDTPDDVGAKAGDAPPAPQEGEPAESVEGLLSSLMDHATSARGRVRSARGDLSAERDPAEAVLAAYERAEPIRYGLDPLDRELSKAIADEDVAVSPALDDRQRAEAMRELRDAYGSVLSTLTRVYEALDAGDALADGGTPADGDGGGDGGFVLPEDPTRSDFDDALGAAEDDLERFRAELNELRSLISTPDRAMALDLDVSDDPSSEIEPRQGSTTRPNVQELDRRLAAGGSLRYFRGHLGDWLSWLEGREFVREEDPVTEVMAAPEFPTPMWRPLKDHNEEFLLPGAGEVPASSVGLVVQNREFIESYMAGLSHEMGRELLWRNYPTDRKGTYFRRFWNKGKGPAWEVPGRGVSIDETPSKDIEKIHNWDESELGANAPGAGDESEPEKVVLLIRGELFRRYPNANVYAAKARAIQGENENEEKIVEVKPMTPDRPAEHGSDDVQFPTFRGRIDPDITFLGFDLTVDEVYPSNQNIREVVDEGTVPNDGEDLGWYFVFEERPGETRFGLEVPDEADTDGRPAGVKTDSDSMYVPSEVDLEPVGWDDMSWAHLVDDVSELDATSYVPLHDSRPGEEGWEVPESATDAEDLEDAVGRAFDEGDVAEWAKNSAHMARISWRKPSRVSFHAMELLPDDPPRQD